jgi:ABC-2 type transport system ATP-binding protein
MIEVSQLQKTYVRKIGTGRKLIGRYRRSATVALTDVNFSVDAGEIVAYLGRNGAGKSTTIKCLTGILHPESGLVNVAGFTPWHRQREFFKEIGVVFGQRTQLVWDLPTRDSFDLLAAQYAVSSADYRRRLHDFDGVFDLSSILTSSVRTLSLGQRMLADLCAVLLHAPKVLFLDEPTLGLDVVTKHTFRLLLRELGRSGVTILLTTHDLAEIERIADRVILLEDGQVGFDGSMSAFRSQFSSGMHVVVTFSDPVVVPDALGSSIENDGLTYTFRVQSTGEVPALVRSLQSLQSPITELNVMPESIDDIVRHVLSQTDSTQTEASSDE